MNETMSDAQVDLVKALLEQDVLDEESAWTFKEIKEVFADLTTGHLNDMRVKGFVRNSGGNINKWWITPKAVNFLFLGLESSNGQANKPIENNDVVDATLTDEGTSQANSDDNCLNCTQDSCGSCDEAKPIPLPQYNPDDVAFKKGDIAESWYMVDGINAQFETSSDAIAAAHDYVATHTMSTAVHIVASRKFAIIKPVVTTELEYV